MTAPRLDGDTFPEYSDVCVVCAHFHSLSTETRTCDSFPNGIPDEIWVGNNAHRKPYPGDGGIIFEPIVIRR